MASPFGPIIATRKLRLLETGRPVTVEVEKPKRRPDGDYTCSFRIRGLGRAWIGHAYGVDSLQALQLAFEALRRALSPVASQLAWLEEPGLLGVYRFVPDILGPVATRRIHRALDQIMQRESAKMVRRNKGRRRGRAAA